MVPVRLDALYAPGSGSPLEKVEALAQFDRLPYAMPDGKGHYQDVNTEAAHISETILTDVFEQGESFEPGIHLHWALPDALTHGVHSSAGTRFPRVPNRWLVTRKRHGQVEHRWLVESDYLYPVNTGEQQHYPAVTIPYPPNPGVEQPFRYLGRNLDLPVELAAGLPISRVDGDGYLPALTAMGPFEVVEKGDEVKGTFAALYPNCFSVFGLHDKMTGESWAGVEYDLLGWCSDPSQDPLLEAIATCEQEYQQAHKGASPSSDDLREALKERLNWEINSIDAGIPQRLVCYGRLTFVVEPMGDDARKGDVPAIAIGNTGTEALAAYLGHQIAPEQAHIIEDQLEAIALTDKLQGRQLDIGAKFQEARHEKDLPPSTQASSGPLWQPMPTTTKSIPLIATPPSSKTPPSSPKSPYPPI